MTLGFGVKPEPVPVTAADLRERPTGSLPDRVTDLLEAAPKRRRSAPAPAKHRVRPKKRPAL